MRDRLIAGAMIPGSLITTAQKFRRWYREQVLALFAGVDAIQNKIARVGGRHLFGLPDGAGNAFGTRRQNQFGAIAA